MFHKLKIFQVIKDARFSAVLVCSLLFSVSASAQFAATPCDPNYYQSLEARAWLEAQREITQNQNLIYKPDSVLEYTCFDNHLREVADHADEMFSETTRWGTILPDTHMDDALEALISAALVAYDTANFPASLLGGRLVALGGWDGTAPTEASGPRYEFESSITAGDAYACDIMQAVWQKAKCLNFAAIPASDGFFTFEDYATGADKRFPTGSCASVAATYTAKLEEAIPPLSATTPWEDDPVRTLYDRFFPAAAGCGPASNNRVQTGLVVEDNTRKGQPPYYYNEAVCLIPGCHWQPSGAGPSPASPATAGTCVPL